jgi:hypothetical protein
MASGHESDRTLAISGLTFLGLRPGQTQLVENEAAHMASALAYLDTILRGLIIFHDQMPEGAGVRERRPRFLLSWRGYASLRELVEPRKFRRPELGSDSRARTLVDPVVVDDGAMPVLLLH